MSDEQKPSSQVDINGDRNLAADIHISGNVSGDVIIGGDKSQTSSPQEGGQDATLPQGDLTNRPTPSRAIPIIVGLLGLVGVVGLCLLATLGYRWSATIFTPETEVVVRVSAEADGAAIARSRVLLFLNGTRQVGSTDSTGTATFTVSLPQETTGLSLVVEAEGYQIEELQGIQIPVDGLLNVRLRRSTEAADVVVLVLDETLTALAGAEVVLLIGGDTYSQVSDSNGLVTFSDLSLVSPLEAQLHIQAPNYQTDYQTLTLQPNTTLGLRLDPAANAFERVDAFAP